LNGFWLKPKKALYILADGTPESLAVYHAGEFAGGRFRTRQDQV
jgi:hypothetical protein